MSTKPQLWPTGEQFTREVIIQTNTDPLPVMITYTVPPFEAVVGAWQNTDSAKSYPQLRQFIVGWDLQETLTDDVLLSFLTSYSGTCEAILNVWCEHMKDTLTANQSLFSDMPLSVN
ncbi:phage tail assembly chaperone [Morganella morganii]|uniref:phage tail assembly chaperone n=1 Tax=Morganella morganii TaxID=582 RepID=UPI003BD74F79